MSITKEKIVEYAQNLGAVLVGFAPSSRWDEYGEVADAYRPNEIWPETKTVIVLGVPILLPILETTPSINYLEQYDTSNILLDQLAYRLAVFLTEQGHASIFLPRDGYGDIHVLVDKPVAAFSHVFAAKYAGLGTIGYSHMVLNEKYGPRVRYVSVFTNLEVEPDVVITKDLCTKCEICKKLCPSGAFTTREDQIIADMNKQACSEYHVTLCEEHRYPCGVCSKVCPIGQDRKLFNSKNISLYLKEREAITQDPNDPEYARWVHVRQHGSKGNRII
ncbi:MAG: queG 6 [Firmicutes bacterium]|nr:queG 6 [Bacillota bacterium]